MTLCARRLQSGTIRLHTSLSKLGKRRTTVTNTEFFTLQTMLTLSCAAAATIVVGNGLQYGFNINPRWLALPIAEVTSIVAVYANRGVPGDYFVGVFNGSLIYCTVVGVVYRLSPRHRQGTDRGVEDLRSTANTGNDKRRFFEVWF